MGNFPALMIKQPEPILEQYGQAQQVAAGAQQLQIGQLQLQQARLNQQSEETLMEAFARNNGDFNKTYADAAGSGKVTPQALMQFRASSVAMQLQAANLSEKQLGNIEKYHTLATNEIEAFKALPTEQRTADWLKGAAGRLANEGVDISEIMPHLQSLAQDPSDKNARSIETQLKGEQWVLQNEKAQREAASAATPAEAIAQRAATLRETQATADLKAAEAAEKGSPLTRMEHDPSQMAGDKNSAAIGYLQTKIADPTTDPKDVVRANQLLGQAKATRQAELSLKASEKAAETAITQGSPTSAAQLLVSGAATLSQLKARGSTPEFIVNTLNEAQRIKPGFSPQETEAQFDVAKSPANLAFFGSAKSLTDKGGTLDQLGAAAKDIPNDKIPVFNTVADAIKASTGSGPIAKYAAIALGVADDYAKVMGGGQGSDTARTQALKLISASQSPEQRKASLEGIAGAVNSQKNSRIGNNPVLKNMYGGDGTLNEGKNVGPTTPANVAKALSGVGTGRHTLSDGSVWDKHADGTVVRAN